MIKASNRISLSCSSGLRRRLNDGRMCLDIKYGKLLTAILCLCLPLGLGACSEVSRIESQDKGEDNAKAPLKLLIGKAETEDVAREILIPGVVGPLPDHSAKVSPAMAGKLAQVLVIDGQNVKRGQLIARLDDRHLRDQL